MSNRRCYGCDARTGFCICQPEDDLERTWPLPRGASHTPGPPYRYIIPPPSRYTVEYPKGPQPWTQAYRMTTKLGVENQHEIAKYFHALGMPGPRPMHLADIVPEWVWSNEPKWSAAGLPPWRYCDAVLGFSDSSGRY